VASLVLANGAASGATPLLPGGTYTVTAHYAGDGTFGASDSTPPVQVTVSPEPSVTHVHLVTGYFPLSFTATNALYGDFYVRVDVTNASNQLCTQSYEAIVYPCPTGQVTLAASGQPLPNQSGASPSAYELTSSGYTEDQFPPLPPGTYSVVANYSGDSSYQPNSSTTTLTITKGPTFTNFFASPAGGESVTLTAFVDTASAGSVPSGTVQFLNGSTPISGTVTYKGTAYTRSSGAASYLEATMTTTLVASANITAQYSGDSNYEASTSTPTQVLPPDFALAANPSSLSIASPGQSAASAISVAFTNGFTGNVNLTCSTPASMSEAACSLNPTSLAASGSAALLITTTGPHTTSLGVPKPTGFLPGGLVLLCLFLAVVTTLMVGAGARGNPSVDGSGDRWGQAAVHLRARRFWAVGLLAAAMLAAALSGCGGAGSSGGGNGNTDPGTPTGNYTLTVAGTSGSITHSLQINVSVQ
jgi:hypothetical protein